MDDAARSEVLSDLLERLPNTRFDDEAKAELCRLHGAEAFTDAEQILHKLMHCPVDWSKASMDQALDVLWSTMASDYPWLSKEAKTQINYAFIMAWK